MRVLNVKLPSDKQLKEFDDWEKDRPSHDEHGEDSWQHPMGERLTQAKCWNWRMEGNQLYCDTDFGPMRQTILTSHILVGEKNGQPLFREIKV